MRSCKNGQDRTVYIFRVNVYNPARRRIRKLKAVIYARYSSDNQREESIEGQIRECTEYADRKEYTIIEHYIDRALSARTDDRPEFQRMIKDSEKHLFDTVLVWKLDRFSRDRYDSTHYKRVLKKNGVKVVSATESISDGPEGIILESMLEGMAEYYSAELKEKVRRGHKENALKCKHNGGTTPYGYYIEKENHVLDVEPGSAAVVREIFERFDGGEHIADIMRSLNGRGILCSYGHPFTKGRINAILRNRRYLGEYKYDDIVVPGGIPAIVDQDLFDRVNRRLDLHRVTKGSGTAKEEYILTTKLFCGECGRLMAGESGTGQYEKHVHRYYKCSGAKSKRCSNYKGIRKKWMETAAVIATTDIIFKDEVIDKIAEMILSMQNKEDPALPSMRVQLKDCEKRMENILKAMEAGIVTPTTRGRLEELEEERSRLNIAISKLEIKGRQLTKYEIVSWINQYRYNHVEDKEYQRKIVEAFINSIYVFGDKYVFIYNFSGKVRTYTREEVKEAFSKYLGEESGKLITPRFMCLKNGFGFITTKNRMNAMLSRTGEKIGGWAGRVTLPPGRP